jgi:hypothetical protein
MRDAEADRRTDRDRRARRCGATPARNSQSQCRLKFVLLEGLPPDTAMAAHSRLPLPARRTRCSTGVRGPWGSPSITNHNLRNTQDTRHTQRQGRERHAGAEIIMPTKKSQSAPQARVPAGHLPLAPRLPTACASAYAYTSATIVRLSGCD